MQLSYDLRLIAMQYGSMSSEEVCDSFTKLKHQCSSEWSWLKAEAMLPCAGGRRRFFEADVSVNAARKNTSYLTFCEGFRNSRVFFFTAL